MANEITLVNGVSKRRVGDSNVYSYAFPTRTIIADGDKDTYKLAGDEEQTPPIAFLDITDPLGAVDIIGYVDALAAAGYFFDAAITVIEASIVDSEIVVKEASQLAGVLRSDVVYIIDDGVPMGAQQITVPAGGLYLRGISNNIGGLSSAEPNYSMFIGGGNLFIDNLQIEASGVNSKAFSLTDPTGFNAVECTTVNFNNCTSLGSLTRFRQGLWQNVGLFDCDAGLMLNGNWLGGFAIFTAIIRTFDVANTGSAVLEAGLLATFGSRIYSDANIEVNNTSIAYKFVDANFTNDQSFELINGILSGTGVYISGITVASTKSLWSSVGIPSTLPGGKMKFTLAVTTPIAATSTPVKALGTTTLSDPIWVSQPVDNRLQWDSAVSGNIRIDGVLSIVSGNNNQVRVSMRIYDSLNVLVSTLLFPIVTTNGGGRAENVTIVETLVVEEGDYIELWVENLSSTSNITVEADSLYLFEQRKAV